MLKRDCNCPSCKARNENDFFKIVLHNYGSDSEIERLRDWIKESVVVARNRMHSVKVV